MPKYIIITAAILLLLLCCAIIINVSAKPIEITVYYYSSCQPCRDGEAMKRQLEALISSAASPNEYKIIVKNTYEEKVLKEFRAVTASMMTDNFVPDAPLVIINGVFLFGIDDITDKTAETVTSIKSANKNTGSDENMKLKRTIAVLAAIAILGGALTFLLIHNRKNSEIIPKTEGTETVAFKLNKKSEQIKGLHVSGADETAVLAYAESLVSSGLKAKGYEYIILSDWQSSSRGEDNALRFDRCLFPGGEAIIQKLKDGYGVKVGLNTSAGELTAGGKPGSLHFEELDAKTFAKWGVDYVRYDYSHMSENYPTYTPNIISLGVNKLNGATSQETIYLSEAAELTGGASLNNDKHIIGLGEDGGTAVFIVTIKEAGEYILSLNYVKKYQEHEGFVQAIVNDNEVCGFEFPRTSGWHSPSRVHGTVTLKEGENTVVLVNPVTGKDSYALVRYEAMEAALNTYNILLATNNWATAVSPQWIAIDQKDILDAETITAEAE